MSLDLTGLTTFIFDLDGVVWRGEGAIPGAVESITELQRNRKRCYFATNNSSRPPRFYAERLNRMGIGATPEDVMTSATATALYLKREVEKGNLPARFCAYVVGEEGIAVALRSIGARVLAPGEEHYGSDVVVVGIDRTFTYEKLRIAQQLILGGAKFIATNRDATYPVEGGVIPGAGSIVTAVETSCGITPVSLGKPEPGMLNLILEQDGSDADHACMIGDRLDTDIACGHRANMLSLFVGTGVTPIETARAATGEMRPDSIYVDLPELLRDAVDTY
jgi:4-nitrophenyl phosphatase